MKPSSPAYNGNVPQLHIIAASGVHGLPHSWTDFVAAWDAWQKADESENVDGEGRSLLHAAVYGGSSSIILRIAQDAPASKQIWCPDMDGRTPLHAAVAERRDYMAVQMLHILKERYSANDSACQNLTAQAVFDAADSFGRTVLDLSPSRDFWIAAVNLGFHHSTTATRKTTTTSTSVTATVTAPVGTRFLGSTPTTTRTTIAKATTTTVIVRTTVPRRVDEGKVDFSAAKPATPAAMIWLLCCLTTTLLRLQICVS